MTDRLAALALAAGVAFFWACDGSDDTGVNASGWVDRTAEWDLDFVHQTGGRGEFHLPEIMGGGVALFDADGDGDADLYLTNGNDDPARGVARAGSPANAFYRNEGGRFVEATLHSGLGDTGYGMGTAIGDVDNDGDLDVYVANFGPDRLYVNDGTGVFTDATDHAGLDSEFGKTVWSSSALFLDYDADGWLDLFVAGYVRYRPEKRCTDAAGRSDYCGPSMFVPEADRLFRNRGNGTFENVTTVSGLSLGIGRGLGVVAFDADGDRRLDLYVANDGDPNRLWIQQDDGRFVDEALLRGVAYNQAGETEAGMGVVVEDFDGNGTWDLFVTHLTEESNTLYVRGEETFRDRSAGSGLGVESVPFTGFGTAAVDLEFDGDLDLLVANGRVSGGFGAGRFAWDRFAEPDLVFLNDGNGRFSPVPWGTPAISRGLATADLDADGDVDWIVANVEGAPRVWINRSPDRGHWLGVRALLSAMTRDATGAEVIVEAGGQRMIRRIDGGGGYLSSSEPVVRFGLGTTTEVDSLTLRWPGGVEERFPVPGIDRTLVVIRGTGSRP